MLNLKKNDILNLSKTNPGLKNIRVCAGWDVAKKSFFSFKADYDLDLMAILLNENGHIEDKKSLIYFGNLKAMGIYLHGDNLTGKGDGDDEMISVALDKIPKECSKIIFAVTIYEGKTRGQSFAKVENAFVRIVDEDNNDKEICRYDLTESGGSNTAIIFAELIRENNEWNFKAVGKFLEASVGSLYQMYR